MSDIFDLVHKDEQSFDLEIMGEKDGKPIKTGVVFNVRDLNNAETQSVLKKKRNEFAGKRMGRNEPLSDEEAGEMYLIATTEPTDEMIAHCVTGWKWPKDAKFGDCDLKFTYANVLAVLKKAPWVKQQVTTKALQISGFIKA